MARAAPLLAAAAAAHAAGRLAEAELLCRRALRAEPEHAEALHWLGILAHRQGLHGRALGFLDRALRRDPLSSQAENNRASVLNALGRHGEALAAADRAVALRPDDAGLHYTRGNTLMALDEHAAALASFERATTLAPGMAQAWQNMGVVLTKLARPEAALAVYDRLIELHPASAAARQRRGEALLALARPEAAVADFARAVALDPSLAEASCNRAWALDALNRRAEALAACDAAIAAAPDFPLAHFNAATIALALGEYERGWRDFEWRWREPSFRARRTVFSQPLWLGAEDIAGHTILLHAEQGFGDTLQFCRYAPLMAARGARVLLQAPAPLLPLLRTLDGVSALLAEGETLPEFDFHAPLMSLPLAFGTTLQTVPAARPYLRTDPARVAIWRQRLGEPPGLRVGLAWSGSASFRADATRSAPLVALAPLLLPGIEYVAVQKEVREADREAAASLGVRLLGERVDDFADAAALTALCDLVISVDSAPAHLAGALGRPVWLLLHHAAEWRWLMAREDSPWYPTARLFRQATPRDWPELAGRVAAALKMDVEHDRFGLARRPPQPRPR